MMTPGGKIYHFKQHMVANFSILPMLATPVALIIAFQTFINFSRAI